MPGFQIIRANSKLDLIRNLYINMLGFMSVKSDRIGSYYNTKNCITRYCNFINVYFKIDNRIKNNSQDLNLPCCCQPHIVHYIIMMNCTARKSVRHVFFMLKNSLLLGSPPHNKIFYDIL